MFEQYVEPLAYESAFWTQAVLNPDYPLDQLGKISVEVADKYRSIGIFALLTEASVDGYCHNLMRSGLVRIKYLERVHFERKFNEHHAVSGRYNSLVDAIGSGDLSLASRIIELSPQSWQGRSEYVDDYCFAQLLARLVCGNVDEDEINGLSSRYETYLDGDSDARLDVVNALFQKNNEEFLDAFESLLQQREEQIEKEIDRAKIETPETLAQRKIYMDGIAILRLADRLEIRTEREYRMCPSLARQSTHSPFVSF